MCSSDLFPSHDRYTRVHQFSLMLLKYLVYKPVVLIRIIVFSLSGVEVRLASVLLRIERHFASEVKNGLFLSNY